MVVDQNYLKVKKFVVSLFLILFSINISFAENFNFEKIVDLKDPWGSTFVSDDNLIITEKAGKIKLITLSSKEISEINHNLNFLEHGQGGLLDIVFKDNFVDSRIVEGEGFP